MKKRLYLAVGLAVLALGAAQSRAQGPMKSEVGPELNKLNQLPTIRTNRVEIVSGHIAYSGIAVDLIKADNPLQLFNPFASAKYGSAEDNTLRDSITGRAIGLKFLSLRF